MLSAEALARGVLAVASEVRPARLHSALGEAIWEYTEADGKYGCGYRSAGALVEPDRMQLRHDHVIPRSSLVLRMLDAPDEVASILASSLACLVTREEHQGLHPLDANLTGWDRYEAAGVGVWDGAAGAWLIQPD